LSCSNGNNPGGLRKNTAESSAKKDGFEFKGILRHTHAGIIYIMLYMIKCSSEGMLWEQILKGRGCLPVLKDMLHIIRAGDMITSPCGI